MTTLNTSSMSQLTFAWPEAESVPAIAAVSKSSVAPKSIPIGIAVPASPEKASSRMMESRIIPATQPKEARRGRAEHISDLLIVVLDRYGISPDEFLAGLQ
jgi:hypothetical protein